MNVKYDPNVCQHAGICVSEYPSLYKIEDGQFVVTLENASDEEIRESVAKCPSGALTIEN